MDQLILKKIFNDAPKDGNYFAIYSTINDLQGVLFEFKFVDFVNFHRYMQRLFYKI